MKRIVCLLFVLTGCGPLLVPMPSRLSKQRQTIVDNGWNKALTPANRLSRATWLDLLVGKALFEEGVDTLYFHSEKRFSGGTVVMEVRFTRSRPDADRFIMEVRDPQGKVLRREVYSRGEVEHTVKALFQNEHDSAAQRLERKRRWKTIERYFPQPSRDAGADAPSS